MTRNILILSLAFTIVSCGGGGGGSSNRTEQSPNSTAQFSLDSNEIRFSTAQGVDLNPVVVNGTATGVDSAVFIQIILDSDASVSAAASISGTTGSIEITPISSTLLNPGVYTTNIDVRVCNDINCRSQISGSPQRLQVTYTIDPAISTPAFERSCQPSDGSLPVEILIHYNDLPELITVNYDNTISNRVDYSANITFDVDDSNNISPGDLIIRLNHTTNPSEQIGIMLGLTELRASMGFYTTSTSSSSSESCMPEIEVENNVLKFTFDQSMNSRLLLINEMTPIQAELRYISESRITHSDFLVGSSRNTFSTGSNRNITDTSNDASPQSISEVELNRVEVIFQ